MTGGNSILLTSTMRCPAALKLNSLKLDPTLSVLTSFKLIFFTYRLSLINVIYEAWVERIILLDIHIFYHGDRSG